MNPDEVAIAVLVPLVSGLFIGLGIPLAMSLIPPNKLYGFRVRQTLESADVWYPVNHVTGYWCILIGLAAVTASTIALLAAWPTFVAALLATVILAIGVLGMVVHGAILASV